MKSVTEIVWQIFKYDNRYFLQSLTREWISKKKNKWDILKWSIAEKAKYLDYDNIMNTLTSFWSLVHLYWYCKWKWLSDLILPKQYDPYIKWLDNFFKRYDVKTIVWEYYIKNEKEWYQWTFDAVVRMKLPWSTKYVNVLVDYKTWKYYKDFYWIKNTVLKKDGTPYFDNWSLTKVRLQLSLYKDWYDCDEISKEYPIDHLWVIRITKHWSFFQLLDYDISEYIEWKENPEKEFISKKTIWRI